MLKALALLGAGLLLSSCASITRGTEEQIVFDSDPPGAEMRSEVLNMCADENACTQNDNGGNGERQTMQIDRSNKPGPSCVTPCTLPIKRTDELLVTFSKAGYQPQTVKVTRYVPSAGGVGVAGNILVGGAVGLVTDAATGAAYDHVPNPVKVALVPLAGGKRPPRR